MDLDEWEYIPDEGFLEIHDDDGKKIFSRKNHWKIDPNLMFKDYFKKPQFVDSTEQNPNFVSNQIVPIPIPIPVPILFHPPITTEAIKIEPTEPEPLKIEEVETEREAVSQVFFKKTKETHEFADMKMDSPRIWKQSDCE